MYTAHELFSAIRHEGPSSISSQPIALHMWGRNLITRLTSAASPRVAISSTGKVGQKFGVSLPLLTRSPSAWPSRLQYRRCRKSQRDLRITLYMGANQNCIYEEIKRKFNSRNACYQSVHNLLPTSFMSKNLRIKIYQTIILPVVVYGCETWPLTLRVGNRQRLF
jgi:hypothetical protein